MAVENMSMAQTMMPQPGDQVQANPQGMDANMQAFAEQTGRGGDTILAHLTVGEIVVPIDAQSEEVLMAIKKAFEDQGIDPLEFVVGMAQNKINPQTGNMDPLVEGVFRTMLDEQRGPRFDQLMSDTEQRQYNTGERLPDYRGTVAPGTPSMAPNRAPRARPAVNYRAQGGYIEGPGTGTSDSIPAMIFQNGGPVQEARLSDGEFVMTAAAVRGAGGGNRAKGAAKMYQMMNRFEGMA